MIKEFIVNAFSVNSLVALLTPPVLMQYFCWNINLDRTGFMRLKANGRFHTFPHFDCAGFIAKLFFFYKIFCKVLVNILSTLCIRTIIWFLLYDIFDLHMYNLNILFMGEAKVFSKLQESVTNPFVYKYNNICSN